MKMRGNTKTFCAWASTEREKPGSVWKQVFNPETGRYEDAVSGLA
jgi:hypothetical protein